MYSSSRLEDYYSYRNRSGIEYRLGGGISANFIGFPTASANDY